MAETRYYATINAATGTGGVSVTFSLCSGYSAVPSNAILKSVKYKITMSIASSGSIGSWRTAFIKLGSGSPYISEYTTTSYSSNTALNSSGNTYSSSGRYTYGTSLKYSSSDISLFKKSSISGQVKASCTGSASTQVRTVCIYVTYTVPSLTWGATLAATQINNQIKLSWGTTPSYSGGSGSCVYAVNNGTEWVVDNLASSTTSYTLTPTEYGTVIQYTVEARYSGLTVRKTIEITASPPTITWDSAVLTITETEGSQLLIEWGEATGMYGASGSSISYKLYSAVSPTATPVLLGTYDVINATIDQPAKDTYYYIVVAYSGVTSTGPRHYYAAHRTVKRWNGNSWDELIVYCFQGSTWVECIPYRWNGNSWDLLSH